MAKNSGNDFVGIGIGLEHNEAASRNAETQVVLATERTAKAILSSIKKGLNTDALSSTLKGLTTAVETLTLSFNNVKFDKLSKGIGEVDKQVTVFAKNAKESAASIDKAADSTTKKLSGMFNVKEGTKGFEQLKKVVEDSLKFEGIDKGITKINKMRDTVLQVGDEVARISSKNAKTLAEKATPDLSNVKLFSLDKYKAEVAKAQQEFRKLSDITNKWGVGGDVFASLAGGYSGGSLLKHGAPTRSLEWVQNLRTQLAEAKISVQKDIDALQLSLKESGEKLWKGMRIPDTYVVSQNRAHEQALKDVQNLKVGVAGIAREYDTLQKKVVEYNRTAAASKQISLGATPGSLTNISSIVTPTGLQAAQVALADLNKQYNDLTRAARTDNILEKRMENLVEVTRKADVRLEELQDRTKKLNNTFANVTSKTYTDSGGKGAAVASAQNELTTLFAAAKTGGLTPELLDRITASIRKLSLAMTDYAQTGSRVKNSTGSPFDNLFRGIPRLQVTVDVMKQQIEKALTSIDKSGAVTKRTLQSLDDSEFEKIQKQLKRFGYTMNQTTGEVAKLKSAADQTKGMFSWLPESLGGMAARLTEFYSLRTIIFAVSAQFRDATRSAIELNQAVHDIIAISGESSDKFGSINDSIYNIAKNSRFTAQEVAGLMQVLAQAGVQARDLPTVSEQVGKFATATASDPKTAADLATTAMQVYNLKAESMTRITNAMTAALNLSKLEAGGLATAFNYLAPQAAQLGMSMEQTLGIVATMAQSGIKASTIGTGVSQMLKEFSAPKERLRNMLKDYGLVADDINPMKREFADIIQTLQEKGVTVDRLFQAMETRVGRAAVTAINLSANSFREMTASLTGTQAALIAYTETMDGAKARMNQLKQTTAEIASNVGEQLAPVFIQMVQALRGWLTGLGTFNGSLATVTVGVVGLGAGLLAMWKTAGLLSVGLTTLAGGAGAAAVAAGTLKTTLMGLSLTSLIGPQAVIVLGLAAVAAGIVAVGKVLDRKKQKQEEATKADLEAVAQGERLDRTLNSIAHSNNKVSSAYTKYYAALKAGKKEEDALAELSKVQIEIKDEQRKALLQYVAEGGPHSQYIDALLKEKGALAALVKLEQLRRGTTNETLKKNIVAYQTKFEDVESTKDDFVRKYVEKDTAKYRFANGTPKAGLTAGVLAQAQAKGLEAFRQHKLKVLQAERDAVWGNNTFKNELTGKAEHEASFDPDGRVRITNIIDPKKPKTGDPSQTSKDKFVPKDLTDANLLALMKQKKDTLNKETTLNTIPTDELVDLFFEREGNARSLVDAFKAAPSEGSLKALLSGVKTMADMDDAIAYLSGESEVDKVKALGLKGKEYQANMLAAKAKDAGTAAQNAVENESVYKKELDRRRKEAQAFTDGLAKLDDEIAKKVAEAEKRKWSRIMEDGNTSPVERDKAYYNFLAAESKRVEADADLKVAPSLKGLKPDSEAYKNVMKKRDFYVQQDMAVVIDDADAKKHTGQLAGLDIEQKTAETLFQTKKAAAALQEQEVWGAEKLKDLKAQSLRDELKHTEVLSSIAAQKWAIAKSPEEEARWEAELLSIEERRKKVNQELAATTQGLGADFADGMKAAWNSLSDISKLTKDLGASLTNTFVNGLGGAISNTFSAIVNPDKSRINELNKQIADLRKQKTDLETNINIIEGNTSKTPQEIKQLADYKTQLDGVNSSLAQQEAAVKKQKDAWAQFASGLKGIMKVILQELQNYIAKLIAVWLAKKLVGFAVGTFGADEYDADSFMGKLGVWSGAYEVQAKGGEAGKGPIQYFAEGSMVKSLKDIGGWVPSNIGTPGKDSVPTMLMPGEVVIRKDMVDYYGKDFLLALNAGKIEKLASGGVVGSAGTQTGSANSGGAAYNLQIVNITQGSQIPDPGQQADQIINVINSDIARKGPTYKNIKGVMRS